MWSFTKIVLIRKNPLKQWIFNIRMKKRRSAAGGPPSVWDWIGVGLLEDSLVGLAALNDDVEAVFGVGYAYTLKSEVLGLTFGSGCDLGYV